MCLSIKVYFDEMITQFSWQLTYTVYQQIVKEFKGDFKKNDKTFVILEYLKFYKEI